MMPTPVDPKPPTKAQRRAAAQMLGRKGGLARAKKLSPSQRSAIARHASAVRHAKKLPIEE